MDATPTIDELIRQGVGGGDSSEDGLDRTGQLIDLAHDHGSEIGLETALRWSRSLSERDITQPQRGELEYFIGNAWESLNVIRNRKIDGGWAWENHEVEKAILHYRRALRCSEHLHRIRLCQIHTNLGNCLSHIGRFVDAVEEWDRALAIDPSFGMALGNRGKGLFHYASVLYDPGHQGVLLICTIQQLEEALNGPLELGAREPLTELLRAATELCERRGVDRRFDLDGFELGTSEDEAIYRAWCLKNRLFLNPLNDVGPHSVAATDVLLLPNLTLPFDRPPSLIGFYNQLKQEYVSARYFLYRACHSWEVHFSDREVKLINTLDYPVYCLAVEEAKAAFRTSYSVLDKAAFFLNEYFELGLPPHRTKFRTVWYRNHREANGLRHEFMGRRNWPLRGLFWLSKDLLEERAEYVEAMSPDARQMSIIRNHLEHKYLKIHDSFPSSAAQGVDPAFSMDTLAYSVTRSDFEQRTMRALKLARAALIHLSLSVHSEERAKGGTDGTSVLQMQPDVWDDGWKV